MRDGDWRSGHSESGRLENGALIGRGDCGAAVSAAAVRRGGRVLLSQRGPRRAVAVLVIAMYSCRTVAM